MSQEEQNDEYLWMYQSFPDSYPDANSDYPDAISVAGSNAGSETSKAGSCAGSNAGSYAGSCAGSYAGSETSKAASLVESVSSFLSSSSTVPSLVMSSWHSAADKFIARTCGGPEDGRVRVSKKDARCQGSDRSSHKSSLFSAFAPCFKCLASR